ncbi:MAG: hypothetical protein AABY32_00985 [Nanoarchaeota archaeon]
MDNKNKEITDETEMLLIRVENGKVHVSRSSFSHPIHILVADYDNPNDEDIIQESKSFYFPLEEKCLVQHVWESVLMPKDTEELRKTFFTKNK